MHPETSNWASFFEKMFKEENNKELKVESIYFNDPYTTVVFDDGSKTTVKCHEDDIFDEYQGFTSAITKHVLKKSGVGIAELIESKAKRKVSKKEPTRKDTKVPIKVGTPVLWENMTYWVTAIEPDNDYPIMIAADKESVGLGFFGLKSKYGLLSDSWTLLEESDIVPISSHKRGKKFREFGPRFY